jgi:hypothetical protein
MTTDAAGRLRALLGRLGSELAHALGAGPAHRRHLRQIDYRIVVAGIRGKSTMTRWLHDVFTARGYDTFAKITGDVPQVLYNGTVQTVTREETVRLYENERELARFDDVDVAIVENQGIRQYTTRLVNEQFVDPDLLFLTNVREDHLDTLGRDRIQIARALARAVPSGTPVVCGEQDEALRRYLWAELDRRDAPVTFVDIAPEDRSTPGAECVYGLDAVFGALGEPPLSETRREGYLDRLRPTWRRLPGGRVFNAAPVNDVQSTELARRSLVGDTDTVVEPLLNLRRDRRGRTASFLRYLGELADANAIERAHVVGYDRTLFETNATFPVVSHGTDSEPAAVLDAALKAGNPVMLMGNTVTEFMRSLLAEVDARAERVESSPPDRVADGKPVEGR